MNNISHRSVSIYFYKNKTIFLRFRYHQGIPTSPQPRYNKRTDIFKRFGVDSILCASVSDTLTTDVWKADQKTKQLTIWKISE
ncbi:hypothetical protein DF214_12730 [Pectobacterium atrosepticum]|nr:hypothetical protein EV46_21200 [Pectobacterium atrosepticum]KFX20639.1 hypothetical protein KP24_21085 [Pectobacterium atrosepticum]PWD58602.1 hypothetical protein DF214_12730 [Pectobacterium atrosepticum]